MIRRCLCALILLQGCFLLPRTARIDSPSTEKRRLVQSFTMQSIDVFYGDDRRDPDARPTLRRRDIALLQNGLQSAVDTLRSAHQRLQSPLGIALGRPLRIPRSRLQVTDQWLALAYRSADTIFLDTRIAHSILHAAVLSVRRDSAPSRSRFRRRGDSAAVADTGNGSVMRALRKLREDVHGLKEGGFWSAFSLGGFDEDEVKERFRAVSNRYAAGTLFVIGHEMGHQAFGHDTLPLRALSCTARQDLEFEADRYATLLTMFAFVPLNLASFGFGGDQVEIEAMIGNREFLGIAYDLAGFSDDGAPGTCAYPEPAERVKATSAVFQAAKNAVSPLFGTTFESLVDSIKAVPLRGPEPR